MATTTNYGWTTPDDSALVKDGASAIRLLGTAIDTTTKNLNPSTTLGDIEYRSSTANTNTRLAIGSTGNVLTVSGGVPVWSAPAATVTPYAIFQDQKTQNTNGGVFTSGAWRTRDLNTSVANTITSASLSSNQITLPAGTYNVTAYAQAEQVNQHQLRFYNITDSSETIAGLPQMTETVGYGANTAILIGNFVITGTKVFELQHRCNTTKNESIAMGRAGNFTVERYGTVIIEKVA